MKIDKKTIDTLCKLPDDKLWSAIRLFASSSGISLDRKKASPAEMAKIRNTLTNLTEADISRAGELLKNYRDLR